MLQDKCVDTRLLQDRYVDARTYKISVEIQDSYKIDI